MRESKFRAWDECNKIMHNDFQFITSGSEGNDWIVFSSDRQPLDNSDTNIFENPNPYFYQQLKKMQYTGLKDENGIEIYEGDVVRDSCGTYEIMWSESHLAWVIGNHGTAYYDRLSKQGELEVIGNIYENTELLKEN
jgi:hypothetical protein